MRWGLRATRASKACSKKALSRASSLWASAGAAAGAACAMTAGAAAQSARTAADEIRRRRMRKTPSVQQGAHSFAKRGGTQAPKADPLPVGEGLSLQEPKATG